MIMLSTILLSVLLVISIVINILLYKALRVQLKKIDLYEKWVIEYETWVIDVRNAISSTYDKMKRVDEKNLFFKDDDVGFVFSELLYLLKQLNDRTKK